MDNQIVLNLFLSVAGLLTYSLFKVGSHLRRFSLGIFWNDNKRFWAWAFSLQIIFALMINYAPETADAITTLSGVDFSKQGAFFTSGLGLAAVANQGAGIGNKFKKIGNRDSI